MFICETAVTSQRPAIRNRRRMYGVIRTYSGETQQVFAPVREISRTGTIWLRVGRIDFVTVSGTGDPGLSQYSPPNKKRRAWGPSHVGSSSANNSECSPRPLPINDALDIARHRTLRCYFSMTSISLTTSTRGRSRIVESRSRCALISLLGCTLFQIARAGIPWPSAAQLGNISIVMAL